MKIDIHSHKEHSDAILTMLDGREAAGIHPWFINPAKFETDLELKRKNFSPNILFIGETGLDRIRNVECDFECQKKAFLQHIQWAKEVNRPLIVHCVRAYPEILSLLIQKKHPWAVMHDFSANVEIAEQYFKHEMLYFSFGHRLLSSKSRQDIFKIISLDHIFFETDDESITLEEVYEFAANLRGISVNELEEQVVKNFISLFKNVQDVCATDLIKNFYTGPITN